MMMMNSMGDSGKHLVTHRLKFHIITSLCCAMLSVIIVPPPCLETALKSLALAMSRIPTVTGPQLMTSHMISLLD